MAMYRFAMAWRRLTLVWASGHAQTDPAAAVSTAAETTVATDTLETLVSFVKLRDELRQDIKALNKQIDSASPRNLATNLCIKETLGISYSLQKESTTRIPETLHRYIQQRAEQEGYGEQLLNLRVEFAQAGNSSLDLAVIANFKGELGGLYKRLRRAIQRWCVDACSEYGWEIPFPQMTLHGALDRAELPGT